MGNGDQRADPGDGPDHPEVMALVSRAVGGDPTAFGALYERFVAPVYQYLYYRTGDRPTAEELTEQVFLHAWQAIARFRWQGRPFVAWLYGLAHNAHVDLLRRARPPRSSDADSRASRAADEATSLAFERAFDQDLLARAICQLSPDQQQVLVLRFAQGLDTPAIAAVMGQDEGAVRALQLCALQRLRTLLTPRPDGAGDA